MNDLRFDTEEAPATVVVSGHTISAASAPLGSVTIGMYPEQAPGIFPEQAPATAAGTVAALAQAVNTLTAMVNELAVMVNRLTDDNEYLRRKVERLEVIKGS